MLRVSWDDTHRFVVILPSICTFCSGSSSSFSSRESRSSVDSLSTTKGPDPSSLTLFSRWDRYDTSFYPYVFREHVV